jgi:hypothetical protein
MIVTLKIGGYSKLGINFGINQEDERKVCPKNTSKIPHFLNDHTLDTHEVTGSSPVSPNKALKRLTSNPKIPPVAQELES